MMSWIVGVVVLAGLLATALALARTTGRSSRQIEGMQRDAQLTNQAEEARNAVRADNLRAPSRVHHTDGFRRD